MPRAWRLSHAAFLAAIVTSFWSWPGVVRAELSQDRPDSGPARASEQAAAPAGAPPGHQHDSKVPARDASVTLGRQVFVQNCARCHGDNAEGKIGPKLVGTPHSAAEIQHVVTHGVPNKMPAFGRQLRGAQITAVAAYVKSLGPAAPGAGHKHEHEHGMGHDHEMGMSRVVGQEMSRAGSGTSWLPESSPMWARHSMLGQWALMQHGDVKVMYDAQGGPRGVSRPVSTNWYMLMGHRPLGKGELMLRTMLSLEPATIGDNGQPQLFQTGEGLIDRQHPHDLFMELATQYSHPLGKKLGAYLYLAPVGEPALGPTAFMHRVSAMEIPTAPLIHHWTDSTHISYGVLTAGVQSRQWKLEGSWFNAHEPDDKRWAIDPIRLNSVSGRLSYAPNRDWVFQVSRGHLTRPEINYPEEQQGNVDRTTASVTYNRPLKGGFWATTFTWGRNDREHDSSDGFLLESNYNWAERNYVFTRIERVDKDELFPHGDPRSERFFTINALSLGYARDIGRSKSFETALGAMATVYAKPDALDRVYGDFPVGVQVFLRIRPRRMEMHGSHEGDEGPMHHHSARPPRRTRLVALLARELAPVTGKLPAPDR
jgi:mono/diheme cytochrome c family protein